MIVRTHSFALLKGAVEGDATKHFGSLLGFNGHAAPLLRAGLIVEVDHEYVATDAGVAFYDQQNLMSLPDGRANYWSDDDLTDAESALLALEGR